MDRSFLDRDSALDPRAGSLHTVLHMESPVAGRSWRASGSQRLFVFSLAFSSLFFVSVLSPHSTFPRLSRRKLLFKILSCTDFLITAANNSQVLNPANIQNLCLPSTFSSRRCCAVCCLLDDMKGITHHLRLAYTHRQTCITSILFTEV